MGLAERRALKEYQEQEFIKLVDQIQRVAGFDVELDVEWDALAEDGMSHMYSENLTKVYFTPLIEGLQAITVDDFYGDTRPNSDSRTR